MTQFDNASPDEHAILRLGKPLQPEDLPARMQCPSGHETERIILTAAGTLKIPTYVCVPCTVTYRFQECTLIPGDEGKPE